jgi:bacteriocin-like protein
MERKETNKPAATRTVELTDKELDQVSGGSADVEGAGRNRSEHSDFNGNAHNEIFHTR